MNLDKAPLVSTANVSEDVLRTLPDYVSKQTYARLLDASVNVKACVREALRQNDNGMSLARLLIVADLFRNGGRIDLHEPLVKFYLTKVLVKPNDKENNQVVDAPAYTFVREEVKALTQDAYKTYCDVLEADGAIDSSCAYTLRVKEQDAASPQLRIERVGFLPTAIRVPNSESRAIVYTYTLVDGERVDEKHVQDGGFGNHWERGHRELKDQLYSYRHVGYLADHYDWLLTFLEHLADFSVEVFDTIDRDIDDQRIKDKAAFEEGIKQKLASLVFTDVLGEEDD